MKTLLMSAEMACAWRDGRKTVTRRRVPDRILDRWTGLDEHLMDLVNSCPYGTPGSQVQLLCGWRVPAKYDRVSPLGLAHDTPIWSYFASDWPQSGSDMGRLRMGRHLPAYLRLDMPRPTIVSIRIERLKDITDAECILEGCPGGNESIRGYPFSATPREHFRHVFESRNGKGVWDLNWHVYRIELTKPAGVKESK